MRDVDDQAKRSRLQVEDLTLGEPRFLKGCPTRLDQTCLACGVDRRPKQARGTTGHEDHAHHWKPDVRPSMCRSWLRWLSWSFWLGGLLYCLTTRARASAICPTKPACLPACAAESTLAGQLASWLPCV